jgi:hypothetical protein
VESVWHKLNCTGGCRCSRRSSFPFQLSSIM